MQLLAIAMAICVLPVPVPPTRTALRCWAMKPPPARSLTSVWLMGVPSNWKSSRSLASGSLAMVSWYLIERACFSLISALSRSPTHHAQAQPTQQSHPCPAAAGMPGTQRGREHLAVSAPDLSRQPGVRRLHRHSRRLPGRLAKTSRRDRSHHLNRTTRLDHHRSISLKAGISPQTKEFASTLRCI